MKTEAEGEKRRSHSASSSGSLIRLDAGQRVEAAFNRREDGTIRGCDAAFINAREIKAERPRKRDDGYRIHNELKNIGGHG